MSYHFDAEQTPMKTLVSNIKNTRPCPFSGRYSLTGSHSALTSLLDVGQDNCHSVSFFMQAGCSQSSDLHVESTCHPRPIRDPETRLMIQNDSPINTRNEFTCHGQWAASSASSEGSDRHLLLLSSGPRLLQEDNSLSRQFMCLEFADSDGIMSATILSGGCDGKQQQQQLMEAAEDRDLFNITSSGPCLQALTGGGGSLGIHGQWTTVSLMFLVIAAAVL
jgi:hypothetical protein